VLLACQGQLRRAPSGQVIGIDMNAALKIGAARGCDLAVLSELLPAAEAGLIEAIRAGEDGLTEVQAAPMSSHSVIEPEIVAELTDEDFKELGIPHLRSSPRMIV
jgi:hypothetical protein